MSNSEEYYSQERLDLLKLCEDLIFEEVLEIGCAYGSLGRSLKIERDNFKIHGIEINEAARTSLNHYDSFEIGNAEELITRFTGQRFDLIVLGDVVEHMMDPWAFITQCVDLLSDSGHILISVPNIANLSVVGRLIVNDAWDYEESGILDKTHIRFFTRKSLQNFLTSLPVDVVSFERNFDSYRVIGALGNKILQKIIPRLVTCQIIFLCKKASSVRE